MAPTPHVTATRHAALEYRRRFAMWPHEAAGLREVRLGRGRDRGILTALYNGHEQGISTPGDGEGPWVTSCETHGAIVAHETIATARSFLSHPANWCEACQAREARAS